MTWTVYILKCADGKFYTGCTSDLDDRMRRHPAGEVPATQDRLPLVLVTYIVFSDKQKAYDFAKYLKIGSGRAVTSGNFRPAFNDPVISSPFAICYASSCGSGSRVTLGNVEPDAVVTWSGGSNMTVLCGQGTASAELSALSATTVEAGTINATIDCPGVTVPAKSVWVGKPKAPGSLDQSLSPIWPGEVKTGQFSSPAQGFETLELIKPICELRSSWRLFLSDSGGVLSRFRIDFFYAQAGKCVWHQRCAIFCESARLLRCKVWRRRGRIHCAGLS
jgi:putative endonuclease